MGEQVKASHAGHSRKWKGNEILFGYFRHQSGNALQVCRWSNVGEETYIMTKEEVVWRSHVFWVLTFPLS